MIEFTRVIQEEEAAPIAGQANEFSRVIPEEEAVVQQAPAEFSKVVQEEAPTQGSILKSGFAGGLRKGALLPFKAQFDTAVNTNDLPNAVRDYLFGEVPFTKDAIDRAAIAGGKIALAPPIVGPLLSQVKTLFPETYKNASARIDRASEYWEEIAKRERPQIDEDIDLFSKKGAKQIARSAAAQTLELGLQLPQFVLGGKGVQKLLPKKLLLQTASRKSKLLARTLSSGGAFGAPAAIQGESPLEIAKSTATGFAFGVAGIAPKPLKTLAEGGALLLADKLLRGNDIKAESFAEVISVLILLKTVGKLGGLPRTVGDINKAVQIARQRKVLNEVEAKKVEEALATEDGKTVLKEVDRAIKAEEGNTQAIEVVRAREEMRKLDAELEVEGKILRDNQYSIEGLKSVGRVEGIRGKMERLARSMVKSDPSLLKDFLEKVGKETESAKKTGDKIQISDLKQERRELLEEAQSSRYTLNEQETFSKGRKLDFPKLAEEYRKRFAEDLTDGEVRLLAARRRKLYRADEKVRVEKKLREEEVDRDFEGVSVETVKVVRQTKTAADKPRSEADIERSLEGKGVEIIRSVGAYKQALLTIGSPEAVGKAHVFATAEGKVLQYAGPKVAGAAFTARGKAKAQGETYTVYRGTGKKPIDGLVFNEAIGPILGKAKYYAFERKVAEQFGEKIETKTITLTKPLIIKTDAEFYSMTKAAKLEAPAVLESALFNPSRKAAFAEALARYKRDIERIKDFMRKGGYDGLIIRVPPDPSNTGLLNGLFSNDQVIIFPDVRRAPRASKQKGALDIESLIPKELARRIDAAGKPVRDFIAVVKVLREFKGDKEGLDRAAADMTSFNAFYARALTILQIAEKNPNIPGFTQPSRGVAVPVVDLWRKWSNERQQFIKVPDAILRAWGSLGIAESRSVGEALLDQRILSRFFSEEQLRKEYFLSDNGIKVHRAAQEYMRDFLNELETINIENARRDFDGLELNAEIKAIKEEMTQLRSVPYFPLSRFGNHAVNVSNAKGVTVEFKQFKREIPSFSDRGSRIGEVLLNKKYAKQIKEKGYKVHRTLIDDAVVAFNEMPVGLTQRLGRELELDVEQMKTLNKISYNSSPGQSFRRRLLEAKKTKGFSEDAMRSFANYAFHGSSHLARLRYGRSIKEGIIEVKFSAKKLGESGQSNVARKRLVTFLEKHFDYVMNPKNEWSGLRAFGFMHYLGFMPFAAFINLTQVPLISLPYLAARIAKSRLPRLSDAEVALELGKATKDVSAILKGVRKISAEEMELLDRALREGITDQSLATSVAGISSGAFLARAQSATKAGRVLRGVLEKGTYLFSMAEGFNRRATLLAAFRLYRKRGRDFEEAYKEARFAVERTQFEYARWNRPEFMRGPIKSNLFLFQQYTQNMLFFAARNPGNLRYLAALFAVAGLEGLPGAEHILSAIDLMLSTKNKKFNSRKAMRDIFIEIGLNPDMMMHGLGSESFGLSYLGKQIGVPIPEIDFSGSLGMGRPIQGLEPILSGGANFQSKLTRTVQEGAGGVFSLPILLWQALGDNDPRVLKRFERTMPKWLRSPVKAARMLEEGGITTRQGGLLTEFDFDSPKDLAEVAAVAIGGRTTRGARAQESFFNTNDTAAFYAARRELVVKNYDFAVKKYVEQPDKDNKKLLDGALQELQLFNKEVPFKGFAISAKSLKRSIRSRFTTRALQPQGFSKKRDAGIAQEIRKSFPVED